ncbi:hypothetical protein [Pseudalkalibacillus sp. SCS-8]|uniref:hypothetical protein n=1 Tax=Pseudalkalibacillus nanhaiensis TaxID=3115291 RepID=UPI0032DA0F53
MNRSRILFWGMFVIILFVYYQIFTLLETYVVPLWFPNPTAVQLVYMGTIVILWFLISLITTVKLVQSLTAK